MAYYLGVLSFEEIGRSFGCPEVPVWIAWLAYLRLLLLPKHASAGRCYFLPDQMERQQMQVLPDLVPVDCCYFLLCFSLLAQL